MSQAPFPQHIRDALDRYDVPPLPNGFADRLLARVETDVQTPLPSPRPQRALGGRWRRTGMVAGSLGLFGMVTAAAAATGFFGEPMYVPVVSEALAKADITPMPKRTENTVAAKAPQKPAPARADTRMAATEAEAPKGKEPDGKAAARDTIRNMWDDPTFRQLPPELRRAEAKQRLRAGMEQGQYSKDELKSAMLQMQAERKERRAQREAARAAFGLPERPKRRPEAIQNDGPAAHLDAPAPRPGMQKLRERLQEATPEEREAILAKMRERREARRAAKAAQSDEKPPETEAVAEPPK
jgi:hypothetical protein